MFSESTSPAFLTAVTSVDSSGLPDAAVATGTWAIAWKLPGFDGVGRHGRTAGAELRHHVGRHARRGARHRRGWCGRLAGAGATGVVAAGGERDGEQSGGGEGGDLGETHDLFPFDSGTYTIDSEQTVQRIGRFRPRGTCGNQREGRRRRAARRLRGHAERVAARQPSTTCTAAVCPAASTPALRGVVPADRPELEHPAVRTAARRRRAAPPRRPATRDDATVTLPPPIIGAVRTTRSGAARIGRVRASRCCAAAAIGALLAYPLLLHRVDGRAGPTGQHHRGGRGRPAGGRGGASLSRRAAARAPRRKLTGTGRSRPAPRSAAAAAAPTRWCRPAGPRSPAARPARRGSSRTRRRAGRTRPARCRRPRPARTRRPARGCPWSSAATSTPRQSRRRIRPSRIRVLTVGSGVASSSATSRYEWPW